MICWHSWDRWSSPVNGIYGEHNDIGYFKVTQIRECKKCGVAEVRMLPKIRSIAELRSEK